MNAKRCDCSAAPAIGRATTQGTVTATIGVVVVRFDPRATVKRAADKFDVTTVWSIEVPMRTPRTFSCLTVLLVTFVSGTLVAPAATKIDQKLAPGVLQLADLPSGFVQDPPAADNSENDSLASCGVVIKPEAKYDASFTKEAKQSKDNAYVGASTARFAKDKAKAFLTSVRAASAKGCTTTAGDGSKAKLSAATVAKAGDESLGYKIESGGVIFFGALVRRGDYVMNLYQLRLDNSSTGFDGLVPKAADRLKKLP